MAIKYYPNRLNKKVGSTIDIHRERLTTNVVSGSKDITSEALDVVISANNDWTLNNIKFNFPDSTARDYSAKILRGRKVVSGLNDELWFQLDTTLPQNIVLSPGFYTGTELALELQTQMDANVAFDDNGITFTVAYDAATGLFTVTPSSGNVKYLNVNKMTTHRYQDSTGGHLLGFNDDTVSDSAATSTDPVFGLGNEAWVIDETANDVTEHLFTDTQVLNIDQALHLETNTAAVTVSYEINYEEEM